jgi:hypothetical protein
MSQGLVHPAVGLREDLADVISVVDAKNTPVSSMAKKGADLTNGSVFSWQADSYNDPSFDGVLTNADVSTFADPAANRALLSGRAQKFRRSIKVDDFAQNVDNVAGVGKKKEMARGVSRSLVEIARDLESAICSDNDSQEQAGATPFKTRGLGSWIGGTTTDLPIPAAYQTPAGSINNTAMSSLTEANVQSMLQSIYTVTGQINTMVLVCGPELKRKFTEFTRFATGSDSAQELSIRTFTQPTEARKITAKVDTFEGDFGTISLLPSLSTRRTRTKPPSFAVATCWTRTCWSCVMAVAPASKSWKTRAVDLAVSSTPSARSFAGIRSPSVSSTRLPSNT